MGRSVELPFQNLNTILFVWVPVVKNTLFSGGGGWLSLLAVSKPESKKAENKAALCGEGRLLGERLNFNSPLLPSYTGKDETASERHYFIARENRDMNGVEPRLINT